MQINVGTTKFTLSTPTRVPSVPTAAAIGVGCSGSDPHWNNGGLSWIVGQKLGTNASFAKCTTPGSPIPWHITNDPAFGVPSWPNLASYEYLHIGDNPNLDGIHDPSKLNQWAQRMWTIGNGGNGGETFLWTLQPVFSNNPTTDAATVATNANEYNIAQDYCNDRMPLGKRKLRQIPGLQMFDRFRTDTIASAAPTATWYADLHVDGFHMVDGKVAYIDSVMSAACMYGIDPKTMPADMQTASGFTGAEATYIRNVISDVIKNFPRAGVNTSAWT